MHLQARTCFLIAHVNLDFNILIASHLCQRIKRNEIVHWAPGISIESDEKGLKRTPFLTPANIWGDALESPSIDIEDLIEFCEKADFVGRFLTMFSLLLAGRLDDVKGQPWPDIFQQPIVYPPPDTHPLSLNYTAPKTPPESSQE